MKAPQTTSTSFEKHPTGWASLICTRIIDKGTVYNDKKDKDERKIVFAFESEKLMPEGKYKDMPFMVFANFNYSMYQNSLLCGFIEQWLGKQFASQAEASDFEIRDLLTKPAYANITHSDDGKWVNIGTIGPLPDDKTPLKPIGDVYAFDMDNIDMEVFEKLTDGFKEAVQKTREWRKKVRGGGTATSEAIDGKGQFNDHDDDIPF